MNALTAVSGGAGLSKRSKPFMFGVMPPEGTRPAPGWEGLYQVARDGRVWSFPKRGHRGKWLTAKVGKNGYAFVLLSNGTSAKVVTVHRLVAGAFIPNPDNKPQVNHKDGVRHNNAVANLEWVTSAENHRHAIDTGIRGPSPLKRMTDAKIAEAAEMCAAGQLQREVAAKFGITQPTLSRLLRKDHK